MNTDDKLTYDEFLGIIESVYPEYSTDEDTELVKYTKLTDFIDSIQGPVMLADLLGKVLHFTMPIEVETRDGNKLVHTIGPVTYNDDTDGSIVMNSIVRRDVSQEN